MHQLKRIAEILDIDLNFLFDIHSADNSKKSQPDAITQEEINFAKESKQLYEKYFGNK